MVVNKEKILFCVQDSKPGN